MLPERRLNQRIPVLVTPPASEPVTVDEAKAFLQLDGTNDDSLIALLISSARRAAESYTKRSFITQTWRLTLDYFPGTGRIFPCLAESNEFRTVELPRGPVVSVTSIKTFDGANNESTVAPSAYTLADSRVMLNEGTDWPTELREEAAVDVLYVAGAATAPEPIKLAILMYVAAMYENRQCADMPAGAKTLLNDYRNVAAFGGW